MVIASFSRDVVAYVLDAFLLLFNSALSFPLMTIGTVVATSVEERRLEVPYASISNWSAMEGLSEKVEFLPSVSPSSPIASILVFFEVLALKRDTDVPTGSPGVAIVDGVSVRGVFCGKYCSGC